MGVIEGERGGKCCGVGVAFDVSTVEASREEWWLCMVWVGKAGAETGGEVGGGMGGVVARGGETTGDGRAGEVGVASCASTPSFFEDAREWVEWFDDARLCLRDPEDVGRPRRLFI